MTPEIKRIFQRFLKLGDFTGLDQQEAEEVFAVMRLLIVWLSRKRGGVGSEDDRSLQPATEFLQIWFGLMLHLASIDKHFFSFSRRVMANTLLTVEPLPKLYRELAAQMLLTDGPQTSKPALARDVVIILGVSIAQQMGKLPTEAVRANPTRSSGCAYLAEEVSNSGGVSLTYEAVEKVWKDRKKRLVAASISDEEALDFFNRTSPMK